MGKGVPKDFRKLGRTEGNFGKAKLKSGKVCGTGGTNKGFGFIVVVDKAFCLHVVELSLDGVGGDLQVLSGTGDGKWKQDPCFVIPQLVCEIDDEEVGFGHEAGFEPREGYADT